MPLIERLIYLVSINRCVTNCKCRIFAIVTRKNNLIYQYGAMYVRLNIATIKRIQLVIDCTGICRNRSSVNI